MDLHVDPVAPPAASAAAPRWFGGLRRRRPRLLGGVAAGLTDFWTVDPLLVRVALVSPFIAGLLALMALPWFDAYFSGLAVLGTQLLWLMAAAAVTGYTLAWVLIPREDAPSIAQKILALEGAFGALVKLVVAVVGLSLLGWAWLAFGLSLANLGLDPMALVLGGFLVAVGLGLAALWTSRERDLRMIVARLGTPGLGRFDDVDDVRAPASPQPDTAGAPLNPPQPGPGATQAPATGSTTARPSPGPATQPPAPGPATQQPHADLADRRSASASTSYPRPAPVPPGMGVGPTVVDAPAGSVDRARAAAVAAAEAEAAAAEAARRARAEQRRARRAAARAQRKQRNRWGWLVASVTLLVAGLLALTDRLELTHLGLLGVGVISLALLTTGILVGSFYGSARWLIVPALVLAGVLATGSAVTSVLDQADAAPAVHLAPKTLSTVDSHHWDHAAVTVDLSETAGLGGRGLDLSVDRGSLTVIVAADQRTSVSSEVLIGTNNAGDTGMRVGDVTLGASGYDEWGAPSDEPDETARLYLNLRVGIGELTVIREES